MRKFLKSLMVVALIFTLALTLTGCGNTEKTKNNNGSNTGENGGTISKCTKSVDPNSFVDVYDYAKDYMIPNDGVYTGYVSQNNDKYFYFTVDCITKEGLDNYKEKLLNNGFVFESAAYKNKEENIKITISSHIGANNYITVYVYPSLDM